VYKTAIAKLLRIRYGTSTFLTLAITNFWYLKLSKNTWWNMNPEIKTNRAVAPVRKFIIVSVIASSDMRP
jgi:hypothetical protein